MQNKSLMRSVFVFCFSSAISVFSYGQQKPVAALFGVDSTKAKTDLNTTVGKPEAKPFDIVPAKDNQETLNNSTKKNIGIKPEAYPTSGPK
jgi:hypothetical protein